MSASHFGCLLLEGTDVEGSVRIERQSVSSKAYTRIAGAASFAYSNIKRNVILDALRLGGSAIGFTIYPGADDQYEMME